MSTHRIGYGYGYGRVSTSDQNPNSQEDALKRARVDKLFIDTFTGTKASRPELDWLRGQLRRGDVLVITRLDRLGRSAKDLLAIAGELDTLGVQLEVLEQNIDTRTPEGKIFFTIVAAFAKFERGIMRSRTMDGLAAARARGRVGGRKPTMTSKHIDEAKRLYGEGKSVSDIAALLSVSRPTIYRSLEQPA
ncbi:MAG: recombinase family protein [Actinomycetales bacterium]|nr:recombinase family protein [Actinomycetales bacterium]